MTEERFFIGQPVRSLQAMLREIAYHHPAIPRLVPDGIFGEETLEAVMIFQREWKLPVTGVVDNGTWDTVVLAFRDAREALALPLPTNGFPARDYQIFPGQVCIYLLAMQAMSHSLSYVLADLEPVTINGIHTGASVRNAVAIQRSGGLPETGVVDMPTWNLLARLYEVFVIRNKDPEFCNWMERDLYPAPDGQWPDGPLSKGFPWEPY